MVDEYIKYLLLCSKIVNQEFSIWFLKTHASLDLVFDILKDTLYLFLSASLLVSLPTFKFEKEEHGYFELKLPILSSFLFNLLSIYYFICVMFYFSVSSLTSRAFD